MVEFVIETRITARDNPRPVLYQNGLIAWIHSEMSNRTIAGRIHSVVRDTLLQVLEDAFLVDGVPLYKTP
jgi:hypothetical protein